MSRVVFCSPKYIADSSYSIYYLQAILNSKYIEWISSLYGEIFRGGYIARGTKVLKQLPIHKIDFENKTEQHTHDSIAKKQMQLIELGDKIDSMQGNKRQLTILQRQFDIAKKELADLITKLYGMEQFDSIIPIIKEQYAAD